MQRRVCTASIMTTAFAFALLAPLTACRLTSSLPQSSGSGSNLRGRVQGGQQAIVGAHIYLFAANTTGYGSASIPLLQSTSTGQSDSIGAYTLTANDGSFSITGDYICTPNSQVYLYALGGNPGAGANPASGLLAVLGNCPAAGTFVATTPYLFVNEVSTIAAAYAMSGFATDATHVSSSATAAAQTGIRNAFASATNLATLSTGTALLTTPARNGTVLQSLTNTLANILAACVNSANAASTSSTCSQLFQNSTSDGTSTGTLPTETATAAINIAHHPGSNIAALFALTQANAPFAPALPRVPNDFAEAITFSANLNTPRSFAFDSFGNLWIADYTNSNLVELSTLGALLSPTAGYTGGGLFRPTGIAVDSANNIWISNGNNSTVSKFSNAGTPLSPSAGFTGGGLVGSGLAIAIDAQGNAWIVNGGAKGKLTKLSSDGTPISTTAGFTGGGLSSPQCIAIDPAGNVWIGNPNSSISEFSSNGLPISPATGFLGGGLDGAYSISIDHAANVWVGNATNNTASEFTNAGSPISPSTGFTGGGLSEPLGTAIDGAGTAWFASEGSGASAISAAGVALSPGKGYAASGPQGVAIDPSGNVWLSSTNDFTTITEFVGLATPVVTPLALGIANNTLGTRP